jgi:predicted outer membrane protein
MKTRGVVTVFTFSISFIGCAYSQTLRENRISVFTDRDDNTLKQCAQRTGTIGGRAFGRVTEAVRLDSNFYRDAMQAGIASIVQSEHAAQYAPTEEVRAFAGILARNQIGSNLRLSESSGIRWPRLRNEDRYKLEELTKRNGHDYETMYLRLMDEHHAASIALFEKARAMFEADERDCAIAETTLSMLRAHAAMIDTLLAERTRRR